MQAEKVRVLIFNPQGSKLTIPAFPPSPPNPVTVSSTFASQAYPCRTETLLWVNTVSYNILFLLIFEPLMAISKCSGAYRRNNAPFLSTTGFSHWRPEFWNEAVVICILGRSVIVATCLLDSFFNAGYL
jgi:hypothetical protein